MTPLPSPETRLFAAHAWLPGGWTRDVLFGFGGDGAIQSVEIGAEAAGAPVARGPVVPGFPNLHSHAFQRAMAGLAERASGPEDSFWTWRQVMYGFLGRLDPDQVQIIASQLYIEMLKAGYTSVGEFHYLHHDPAGERYAEPAEMGLRLLHAAGAVGIGLTLLPVLYRYGGFGGAAPSEAQRRFLNDPDDFLMIVQALIGASDGNPNARLGIAPHSLRAVTPETLKAVVESFAGLDPTGPIHIHIAEQVKEVEDCLAWSRRRPVAWLLDNLPVDRHWCLVHATHLEPAETVGLARSGAVAGLCPTTEANLGDGLFPASDYLAAEGLWGIGSDSHISIDPWEELRLLEYGQRLVQRRRNILRPESGGSVGVTLFAGALLGGARALGRPLGALSPGHRADLLVLDTSAPQLLTREGDALLDSAIFACNRPPVRDVMVGGRWVIEDGHHPAEAEVAEAFRGVLLAAAG